MNGELFLERSHVLGTAAERRCKITEEGRVFDFKISRWFERNHTNSAWVNETLKSYHPSITIFYRNHKNFLASFELNTQHHPCYETQNDK